MDKLWRVRAREKLMNQKIFHEIKKIKNKLPKNGSKKELTAVHLLGREREGDEREREREM
jgi:hypothetical protein